MEHPDVEATTVDIRDRDADIGEDAGDRRTARDRQHTPDRAPEPSGGSPTRDPPRAPEEAMMQLELTRIRRSVPWFVVVLVAAFAVVPTLSGDPSAKRWVYAGLGVQLAGVLWLRLLAVDASRHRGPWLHAAWLMTTLPVGAELYFFGIHSSAAALLMLAIWFASICQSHAIGVIVTLSLTGFHAAIMYLTSTGAIADVGYIPMPDKPESEQLFGEVLALVLFVATHFIARRRRRQIYDSFGKIQAAERAAAQREVLAAEARQELARAVGRGRLGAYTGQAMGSYELGVLIGRGGMGEVYEARHVQTGEQAAVKVLSIERLDAPRARERFAREARLTFALTSPHIVRVLEVGDVAAATPYLAMEYLKGRELSHLLGVRGQLAMADVTRLVTEVARGLDVAAQAGIVHRDIKPSNLFCATQRGGAAVWKILDFGVSTLIGSSGTLTQDRVIGTPTYMAPEQARGGRVDARADIYSLATIVYRALTGHLPFHGSAAVKVLRDVIEVMPRRPSSVAELPRDIDAVLAVGMAKHPSERFSSAGEFARVLNDASRGVLSDELRDHSGRLLAIHPWRRR